MPLRYEISMDDFTLLDEEVNAESCFTEADPLLMDGGTDTTSTQYTNALPANFPQEDQLILRARYKINENTAPDWQLYFYVSDGSRYWKFGLSSVAQSPVDFKNGYTASRNGTSLTAGGTVLAGNWTGDVTGVWHWIMLKIETGNNFRFYINPSFGASEPDVNDVGWIQLTDLTYTGSIDFNDEFSSITSFGVTGTRTSVSGTWTGVSIDDMIMTNETYSDQIGGLNSAIVFSSYYIRTALNGGGNGILTCPSPFFTSPTAATLLGEVKKTVTYLNEYIATQFRGETSRIKLTNHGAIIEVEEMTRKLMYKRVGASPVVYEYFLRYANGLNLIDKDANFVTNNVTTSLIVAFQKSDTKVFIATVDSGQGSITTADYSTAYTPDYESGNDAQLYYNDPALTEANNGWVVLDDNSWGNEILYCMLLPVDIYEKYQNTIDQIDIIIEMSTIRNLQSLWQGSGDNNKYRLRAYNYRTTTWDNYENITRTETGDGFTTSAIWNGAVYSDSKEFNFSLETVLKTGETEWASGTTYAANDRAIYNDRLYTSLQANNTNKQPDNQSAWWKLTLYDYINYESTAGSSSIFSKLNFKTLIQSHAPTSASSANNAQGIWLWSYRVKVTFTADNVPEYSTAAISAVSETQITLSATNGINLPNEDGYGYGDIVRVVKSAEDFIQAQYDASALASDLGALQISVTNGTTTALVDDYTYKTYYQLFQDISSLLNCTFWGDYGSTNFVRLKSADNHTSAGVTITRNDIVGYNSGNWSLSVDSTKQRNELVIMGDNVVHTATITPDADPFGLGDETQIINDSSIKTLLQATNLVTAIDGRHISSEIIAQFTLNYSKPNQNYSGIEVGKTLALKLPTSSDTSICNYSSGTELLIIAMEVNRNEETGWQEHITITLQRRYT